MASKKLEWDKVGERFYETGIEKVVLYPYVAASSTYAIGYAWNGVTGVTESPSGAESTPQYADNKKYVSLISSEDFACSIEAFTYPEKFAECDGSAEAIPGVKVYQQKRNTFGLSYQTQLGNDLAQQDFGYMIHLVYGCTTAPSERAYQTINESPEAMTLSWEISTSAVEVPGFKPSARLSINSTKVDIAKLKALEDILYGTELVEARLPLPAEVFTLINTAG